jgi:hypothetical protein
MAASSHGAAHQHGYEARCVHQYRGYEDAGKKEIGFHLRFFHHAVELKTISI